jgi:hypothetical protein
LRNRIAESRAVQERIASREILPGGVFLAIFPLENYFGLQEDLSMPRVFPIEQNKWMTPLDGKSKIFGEASRHQASTHSYIPGPLRNSNAENLVE